jgi:hypothetical protein
MIIGSRVSNPASDPARKSDMSNQPMRIRQRVYVANEGVGYVESIDADGEFCDVRWLTPNNEPSCVVSGLSISRCVPVGDNVLPQPRSKEWWREAREFCSMVESALRECE